jgi:pseudouridine kinase
LRAPGNPAINAAVRALRQIIVVGAACVDVKAMALSSPLEAGTSNPGKATIGFGGVARNIAENLARLDVPVSLVSAIGDDLFARAVQDHCRDVGIEAHFLSLAGGTDLYSAVLKVSGEMAVAIGAMGCAERLDRRFIATQRDRLSSARCLVCDANLSSDSLRAVGEIAQGAGIPFVFEPVSVRKAERLQPLLEAGIPIALATPNRAELAVLAGCSSESDADVARCCRLLQTRRVGTLIVGLGKRGAFVSAPGHEVFIEAATARVNDVTGAGDAALAAALWAVQAGFDWVAAARAGQYAAGLTVAAAETVSNALTARFLLDKLAETGACEQMRTL